MGVRSQREQSRYYSQCLHRAAQTVGKVPSLSAASAVCVSEASQAANTEVTELLYQFGCLVLWSCVIVRLESNLNDWTSDTTPSLIL